MIFSQKENINTLEFLFSQCPYTHRQDVSFFSAHLSYFPSVYNVKCTGQFAPNRYDVNDVGIKVNLKAVKCFSCAYFLISPLSAQSLCWYLLNNTFDCFPNMNLKFLGLSYLHRTIYGHILNVSTSLRSTVCFRKKREKHMIGERKNFKWEK